MAKRIKTRKVLIKIIRNFFVPDWRKIILFGFFLGCSLIPLILLWSISLQLMLYMYWISPTTKAVEFLTNTIIIPIGFWYFLSCFLVTFYDVMEIIERRN